jgi:putative transposase
LAVTRPSPPKPRKPFVDLGIIEALAKYLKRYHIRHIRSAPYHPRTQGKIERYHCSMKNIIKLENFYYPWMLEETIAGFVDYCNHQR